MSPSVKEILAGNGGDKKMEAAAAEAATRRARKRWYVKKSKMLDGESFPPASDWTVHEIPNDQVALEPPAILEVIPRGHLTDEQIELRKEGKNPYAPGRWTLIFKDSDVIVMGRHYPPTVETDEIHDTAEKLRRDPKSEKPSVVEDPCGAPKRKGGSCGSPKKLCNDVKHVAWREKHKKHEAADDGGGGGTPVSKDDTTKPAGDTGDDTEAKMVKVLKKLVKTMGAGFDKTLEALTGLKESVETEGSMTRKTVTDSATQVERDRETLLAAVRNLGSTPPPATSSGRHWSPWLTALFGVLGFIALMTIGFVALDKFEDDGPTLQEIVDEAIAPLEGEMIGIGDDLEQLMLDHDAILDQLGTTQQAMMSIMSQLAEQGATLDEIQSWLEAESTFENSGDCNVFLGINVDGEILMKNVTNEAPWGFVQCTFAGGDNNAGNTEITAVTTPAPPTGCGSCGGPGPGTTTTTTTTTAPTPEPETHDPTAVAKTTNADSTGNVYISEASGKATICLSGVDSHDNDEGGNSISSYSWTSNQGLDADDVAAPCWETGVADAYYTFTLTVTDDEGDTDTDAVTVHVPGPVGG